MSNISDENFRDLELNQIRFQKELWEPVFIDIKKWKLYIVEKNGNIKYIY